MVQVGDFAVEPEVNAGDGRVLELSEVGGERLAGRVLGQGGKERGQASKESARTTASEGMAGISGFPMVVSQPPLGEGAMLSTLVRSETSLPRSRR